jgi:hypothetical protein
MSGACRCVAKWNSVPACAGKPLVNRLTLVAAKQQQSRSKLSNEKSQPYLRLHDQLAQLHSLMFHTAMLTALQLDVQRQLHGIFPQPPGAHKRLSKAPADGASHCNALHVSYNAAVPYLPAWRGCFVNGAKAQLAGRSP